jgi:hypothetical protein
MFVYINNNNPKMADINIDELQQKLNECMIKLNNKKAKHNKYCLSWYHKNKSDVAEKRKIKYSQDPEYASKLKEKRRERYHNGKIKTEDVAAPETQKS